MSVPAVEVEFQINGVAAGVPEDVAMQTYDPAWISVVYGNTRLPAILNTDYTLAVSEDFETVTITPTASLVLKIAVEDEGDVIFVKRTLPFTTDITENDVQFREKVTEEFDKGVMRDQQLDHRLSNAEETLEGFTDDVTDTAANAAAAAASAAAALASETDAEAAEVAAEAYAAAAAAAGTAIPVAVDLTALKAINTATTKMVFVSEDYHVGFWKWDALVPIAVHTADTQELNYAAPNPAAAGAWTCIRHNEEPLTTQSEPFNAALRGREPYHRVVSDLPAPRKNARYILSSPTQAKPVYSNGTIWVDLTTGAELTPWWLPLGCKVFADFENQRFYWNSAVKAESDFSTDHGDGSYTLTYSDSGAWWSADWYMMMEYEGSASTGSDDNYFSWTNASNERFEIQRAASPSTTYEIAIYHSSNFSAVSRVHPEALDAASWTGRHRVALGYSVGVPLKSAVDGALPRTNLGHNGVAYNAPTKMGFRRRARFDDQVLTNADLYKVALFSGVAAVDDLSRLACGPITPHAYFMDSFGNLQTLQGKMQGLYSADDIFVPMGDYHQGGETLTFLVGKYTRDTFIAGGATYDNTHFRRMRAVFFNGGSEGPASLDINALRSFLAVTELDDWIYVEPNPVAAIGTANRILFDLNNSAMKRFCGPKHYVPTYAAMLAANDGTPNDLADVAAGKWPRSLRETGDDVHPNSAGQDVLAALIKQAQVDRLWHLS